MPRRLQCIFGCDQFDVLHHFPKPVESSMERFLQWKEIVRQHAEGKTNEDIYNNLRICNHHFEKKYLYVTKRLAKTAYPSLKLGPHQETRVPINQPESSTEVQQMPEFSSHHIPNKIVTKKSGKIIRKKINATTKKMVAKIMILKSKLQEQRDQIKAAQEMSRTKLFDKMLKNLPLTTLTFVNMQLKQTNKKIRGRRYNLKEKLLALSIYKRSPKAYTFLRSLFTMPSKRTLQEVIKTISIKPGINPVIFQQINKITQKMTVEKRLCLLMFDEMSISPSMAYDVPNDHIIGFENFGDIDTTRNIADHVIVAMVKGLKVNYKQPIYYGFCKSATKVILLKNIIKKIIIQLFEANMIVVATVCDQSSINMRAINELLAETKANHLRLGLEVKENMFQINNNKIYPLYDTPHLLKCMRNNLLTKNLRFIENNKIKIAKWEHLKLLLDIDSGEDELRMCNKLTETHILPEKIPKMKVKHAAQVFSQRVSGALRFCARMNLLPRECVDTADLLLLFDQLFDSFNGSSYKRTHKTYKNCLKMNSEHFVLWNNSIPILRSMGFKKENKNKDGSVTVSYEKVPCIKNWIHNISTMKDLWQYLCKEYKITSLLLRNLNQDPVENFFSSVRSHGVRNTNPTCQQFESIYKTLMVNNLTSNHSLGANCEKDNNSTLSNLDILLSENTFQPPMSDEQIENFSLENMAGSRSEEPENNKLVIETRKYVAGWILKKCKTSVCKSCTTCNMQLYNTSPPQDHDYILSIDMTKKSLQHPSFNLVNSIKTITKTTTYILKNYPQKKGISKTIRAFADTNISFDYLTCDAHKDKLKTYIINLTIKLVIHSWCTNINRILKGRHLRHDDDDKTKNQAFSYFKTHQKYKKK